jgi:anti-sigma regulatory factor (Ser/Thr protein kinase)
MFTLDRLKESFNRHRSFDPDALVTAIKTDINSFMSGADQYDDITLVALRFNVATNTQDMMTESIGEIIKLEMFADMEVVPATRAMIMDIAARKKYVQSRIQELNTIIDELLTNAIRHGSSSCKSRINLECSFFDNRVEIAVSDEGNKLFDYQAILNEHREIVEREQKEGKVSDEMVGRGLLLIEHFSDRVNVDKSGSGTRISVLKNMGE